MNKKTLLPDGVMLNAYPDSCGGTLARLVGMLKREEFKDVFSYVYLLPSVFESDLDRGFSVISYDLNDQLARREDLEALQEMGISLKMDFVLNHLSVQSPQFKDLLEKGDRSEHVDTFIDWNQFWEGKGERGPEGYIVPREEFLSPLFMRKPGLPILKVPFPDGSFRFYWNTFYQKVSRSLPSQEELASLEGVDPEGAGKIRRILEDAAEKDLAPEEADFGEFRSFRDSVISHMERTGTSYLGQMDLNADSPKVWAFYEETLEKLQGYGAKIVRLDAFAYLHKQAGKSNFFNRPGTWEHLKRLREMADSRGLVLLPEIHSKYEDNIHEELSGQGYPIYDFFFPGLVIDAIENGRAGILADWAREIRVKDFQTVNMLGCHDGIPVLDVQGALDDRSIEEMIDLIKARGGRVKDLFGADGKKISYYQVNATFFNAFGEDPQKMLLARAVQMFMPGIPEVWYLDIFGGRNDYQAADQGGHKEINRRNLTAEEIENGLGKPLVREQIKLLRFRNTCRAFGFEGTFAAETPSPETLRFTWSNRDAEAVLSADLSRLSYEIRFRDGRGEWQTL